MFIIVRNYTDVKSANFCSLAMANDEHKNSIVSITGTSRLDFRFLWHLQWFDISPKACRQGVSLEERLPAEFSSRIKLTYVPERGRLPVVGLDTSAMEFIQRRSIFNMAWTNRQKAGNGRCISPPKRFYCCINRLANKTSKEHFSKNIPVDRLLIELSVCVFVASK